jgi:hypothetical protein
MFKGEAKKLVLLQVVTWPTLSGGTNKLFFFLLSHKEISLKYEPNGNKRMFLVFTYIPDFLPNGFVALQQEEIKKNLG